MISLERFRALKNETLYKKASVLASQQICGHITLDKAFIDEIFLRLAQDYPDETGKQDAIRRRIESEGLLVLKDYLDFKTGRINADLDFISDNSIMQAEKRKTKERYLVLDDIRSPYNLGSIIRSSESFMIKEVILLSENLSPKHPNAIRAACRTDTIMKCRVFKDRKQGISHVKSLGLPIFCLECGGNDISSFEFPDAGIGIVGNEEFGVSKELADTSEKIVSIPMFGTKGSISVSCATAIMLHRWCENKGK